MADSPPANGTGISARGPAVRGVPAIGISSPTNLLSTPYYASNRPVSRRFNNATTPHLFTFAAWIILKGCRIC
jgi:hypothetical protein